MSLALHIQGREIRVQNTLLEKRSIIKIITFFSHYPFFFFFFFFFLPLSQKSRRQELHRHISLHSETFRNLSSFSLKKAFQHYPFALLCRDEARSSSAFSYLKRLSSTLVDGDAYYKFCCDATSSTPRSFFISEASCSNASNRSSCFFSILFGFPRIVCSDTNMLDLNPTQ
ncbi:uncharacterized protein LOC103490999 isoform X2 [Cucumis melo]|uniref:Uncharacterized protein LOC103490999 isoform X2 n=1 Tax=Cucumis melo TaxID=3656 RepID=A0ABM3KXH1_CUCME|nr:uncharacterized protein LOC103490999 isoform X2 [Cucumis melo]